jgi:hypothetical protein
MPWLFESIITNLSPDSRALALGTKTAGSQSVTVTNLNMTWPPGVHSLSHVAMPFSADDPIYGSLENPGNPYKGLPIGRLQPRGETEYPAAPLSQLMRLRHNSFFAYVEQRVLSVIHQVPGRSREPTHGK